MIFQAILKILIWNYKNMKILTLLEQEALGILKQLEFGCAQFELIGGRRERESAKVVEIPVNNIKLTPLLKRGGNLDAIERFLQSKGVNFSTSFDLIKRPFKFPDGTIMEKTVSGIIKGKNIQDIKTKIEELIHKLNPKELAQEDEEKNNKFPHKLPRGTKWENFIIKFLDEGNVYIEVNKFKHTANYKEMGFWGRGKDPKPSMAWVFLKVLAGYNGEITIKDKGAKDKYKKQKEELSEALQGYFSIDYDPFFPYKSSPEKRGNSYKIKMTLIPPPQIDNRQSNTEEEEDDLGIKKYLDEQCPPINE